MSLKSITPAEAQDLIARGAVLIDIRDADTVRLCPSCNRSASCY